MSIELIILFVFMMICFVMRLPIAFSLLLPGIFYYVMTGGNLAQVSTYITGTMFTNYILIAAPLFIFTAYVMNDGKVTDHLFKFCNSIFGRFRGGSSYVNIFASLIFSGMTGSAVADASGLGIMEIEQMKKEGYSDGFSSALTAASATIGPVFPPSIPFIIFSMLSGASVGALFMAGVVPGVMLALFLMIYVAIVAKKKKLPYGEKYPKGTFFKNTFKAVPALLTPVILLWGIYGGVVTPTEAGALAALYSIIVSMFVYRNMGLKKLWNILKRTARTTAALGGMIAGAYLFAHIIALEQMPQAVANAFLRVTDNKYIFLLIINILFLVLGAFMEAGTIQLIFIPIVLPVVTALGIDLVHFGVMISLNIMIGLSTPPFGMLLFITSGLAKTKLQNTIREVMPMVGVMIVVLFLITYIPSIVTFIPNLYN